MDHAAIEAAFVAALLDPDRPVPAGVTCARGIADARRFAVYRNNVAVGLRRALAVRFPVVERLVGTDFFALMAQHYVAACKPASPLLHLYGLDFPDFIAGFAPAADLPYLADVARLESAIVGAYHAADAVPLEPEALGSVRPDRLADVRLTAHPAAALVASDHPVGSIWQAHQTEPVAPLARTGGETVIVARPAYEIEVRVLPERDAPFARALLGGATLSRAAQAAAADDPDFDFGSALVGLIGLGVFASLTGTEGDDHG